MADLSGAIGNFNDSINSTYLQRRKEQQFNQERQQEMMKTLLAFKEKQDTARREAALKSLLQVGQASPEDSSTLIEGGYGGMLGQGGQLRERPEVVQKRQLDHMGALQSLATGGLGLAAKQREYDAPRAMQDLLQRFGGQGSDVLAPELAKSGLINPNQYLGYRTGREDATTRQGQWQKSHALTAGNVGRSQQRELFTDSSENTAASIAADIDANLNAPDADGKLSILQQAILGAEDLRGVEKQDLLNRITKVRQYNSKAIE